MSRMLRLRDDVDVVTVGNDGFLLRQPHNQKLTKLGSGFSVLLPLLKAGCAAVDMRDALIARGCDRRVAETSADKIALSLEEAGLLIGSRGTRQARNTTHLTWESDRFVPVVEAIARRMPNGFFSVSVQTPIAFISYLALLYMLVDAPRGPVPAVRFAEVVLIAAMVALWFLGHELMHGVAAVHNGCRIKGIGIRLQGHGRFSVFPFCRLVEEDVIFKPAAHVGILFAGPAFDFAMALIVLAISIVAARAASGAGPLLVIIAASLICLNTNLVFKSDTNDIKSVIARNQRVFASFDIRIFYVIAALNLMLVLALIRYIGTVFLHG